jgi:hypothetical protein
MKILSIYAWIFSFFCQDSSNRKKPPLIELLISKLRIRERRAIVNHADDEGRTALHLALMRGRFRYAEYLIDCGANIDVSMNSISQESCIFMQVLSKLNASVLHFVFFPGNTTDPGELNSMVEYIRKKQSTEKNKELLNLCMLDNRTPLVFLACHQALQLGPPVNQTQQQQKSSLTKEQAVEELMAWFSKETKDENQILATFDMIARRYQLQKFDHLKYLVQRCSFHIRKQILHIVCRHDNDAFLGWLINQGELKEHLNTADYAGYTPLLTATFYNSKKCVEKLIKVCFYFLIRIICKAGIERNNRHGR